MPPTFLTSDIMTSDYLSLERQIVVAMKLRENFYRLKDTYLQIIDFFTYYGHFWEIKNFYYES